MLKIGIIGIRGYDVIYSGFETFVIKLIEKSDNKYFYYYLFCRNKYQKIRASGPNFSTIISPTLKNKYLETPFYSLFSNILSLSNKIDIVLYLGLSNTFFIFFQKLFKRKTVVNVDGLDWQRKRWNFLGKIYLKICEKLTVLFADYIICDSKTVYRYFQKNYPSKNLTYISYGAEVKKRKPDNILKKYRLEPNKYFHFVGRLTPENSVEDLIYAFKAIRTNFRCVIVGDSVYENKYKNYLLNLAKSDNRIIFTGFLKGKDYEEICSNSALYVETKSVGGTHPSLLEAIAFGNIILAKCIPEHKEVLGENTLYYDLKSNKNSLINKLEYFINKNSEKVEWNSVSLKNNYSWEKITKQYEKIFRIFSLNHEN